MVENPNQLNTEDTVEETGNEAKSALEDQWSREDRPGNAEESAGSETPAEAGGGEDPGKFKAERDEYLNDLKRLQAEFDNYRKRVLKERSEMTEFLLQNFITRLLDVVESMERALKTESTDAESYRAGVRMVHQQLMTILGEQGLTRIESVGKPFDPNLHEAVMQIPSREHAPGTVVTEFSPGYLLKDRVLKAPKVQVAVAASE